MSVLCNASQYAGFAAELRENEGSVSAATRRALAAQAFATSARYDASIAQYFEAQSVASPSALSSSSVVAVTTRCYEPAVALKYGCNPHQKPAAILKPLNSKLPFAVISGTPGYINLLDALNAWQLVRELREALNLPAAASFKHVSPAGAAVSVPLSTLEALAYEIADPDSLSPVALAYVRARNADPMCSFGDFVAVSDVVDECTARVLKTEVCDGIIGPGFEPAALEILRAKKKGAFIVLQADVSFVPPADEVREVYGAVFRQKRNETLFTAETHLQKIVAGDASRLTSAAQRDLVLASIAVKYTQSNSVGFARNGQMIGVGAGQQSRVDCVKLALKKAQTWYLRQHPKTQALAFQSSVKRQERVNARVRYIEDDLTAAETPAFLAQFAAAPQALSAEEKASFLATLDDVALSSDAFFPFRDSLDQASKAGVRYVAQPGGSIADADVIAAAQDYGMTMCFTDLRLFHH